MSTSHKQRKRKRICEISKACGPKGAMDLFVPLPMTSQRVAPIHPILRRLQELDYKYVALTHIVDGRPKDPEDRAMLTLPDEYIKSKESNDLVVLRRIHCVVDNVADMAIFAPHPSGTQQIVDEYDLVSIGPRSDEVFQSACTCAGVDIVALDGSSSSSNKLPYTIRSTDIRALRKRNAILEIPYANPVLNSTARRGWIQTSRSVVTASLGGDGPSVIPILFSSGIRVLSGSSGSPNDAGAMAIHTPGDLVNLFHTVLGLDTKTAINSITKSGQMALNHAQHRRHGNHDVLFPSLCVAGVVVETDSDSVKKPSSISSVLQEVKKKEVEPNNHETDDDDNNDEGFISF